MMKMEMANVFSLPSVVCWVLTLTLHPLPR